MRKIAKNYMATLPETQEKVTLEHLKSLATRLNTVWFRYFLTFDPSITLKQVRVPVLVLNGELDLQVSSKQNLPVISKGLEESGNKDFTIIELPKLNHFFQTCETGSIAEYEKIEETMSPLVLNLITEWILERTTQDNSLPFQTTLWHDLSISLSGLNFFYCRTQPSISFAHCRPYLYPHLFLDIHSFI